MSTTQKVALSTLAVVLVVVSTIVGCSKEQSRSVGATQYTQPGLYDPNVIATNSANTGKVIETTDGGSVGWTSLPPYLLSIYGKRGIVTDGGAIGLPTGSSAQLLSYSGDAGAYRGVNVSGSCTISQTGVLTCTSLQETDELSDAGIATGAVVRNSSGTIVARTATQGSTTALWLGAAAAAPSLYNPNVYEDSNGMINLNSAGVYGYLQYQGNNKFRFGPWNVNFGELDVQGNVAVNTSSSYPAGGVGVLDIEPASTAPTGTGPGAVLWSDPTSHNLEIKPSTLTGSAFEMSGSGVGCSLPISGLGTSPFSFGSTSALSIGSGTGTTSVTGASILTPVLILSGNIPSGGHTLSLPDKPGFWLIDVSGVGESTSHVLTLQAGSGAGVATATGSAAPVGVVLAITKGGGLVSTVW
jgi:hypothetical protein